MIKKDDITTVTKVYFFDGSWSYNVVTTNIKCTVPNSTSNTDYQEIQKWIAGGGTVIDNGGGE
jgi:exoribonuclease R|tara:strand:+ start:1080 stop:1268 length:189 start_codon:yes stop_codon:yes gene_type:complete